MRKIIFAIVLSAILGTSALVTALEWDKGTGIGMGYVPYSGGPAGRGIWKALNLSLDQQEKMQALRKSFLEESLLIRTDLMNKQFELKALWVKMNPDGAKILPKQKEINDLRAQLQEKATKYGQAAIARLGSPQTCRRLMD